MTDLAKRMSRGQDLSLKVGRVLQTRINLANEKFSASAQSAAKELTQLAGAGLTPWNFWSYGVDAAQRAILFWDALRQRGNQFVERAQQGLTPVLRFAY